MNATSRPEERPADSIRTLPRAPAADLEHQWDREIIAAVAHFRRAARGLGYRYELPPSLRGIRGGRRAA